MRGVVFTGDRQLELMQFPDPAPDADDVIIEMKASGMCGSDLHQYRRPRGQVQATGIPMKEGPVIAGHEPCGVVVEVGTSVGARQAYVGQRVMVHHYQGYTQCNHCRAGWQQLCQEVPVKVYGNNAHGGHAQYLKVPANTLVPLPEELTFTAGAAIACGSGTAYSALRRIGVGHDVFCRGRWRRPHRGQPASVAPAIDAGGVMDVLQHHPGRLRAVFGRARHRRR